VFFTKNQKKKLPISCWNNGVHLCYNKSSRLEENEQKMKIFCRFSHETAGARDCHVGRNFGTEWTKTHLLKEKCISDIPLVETWWKRWKTA